MDFWEPRGAGGRLPGKPEQRVMNPKMATSPPSAASGVGGAPTVAGLVFCFRRRDFTVDGKWIQSMSTEVWAHCPLLADGILGTEIFRRAHGAVA